VKNFALALLAALLAVNVYRACTQSIVHDEAYTYQVYLDAPVSALFERYDANHHILYTFLAKLCVVLFGPTEWSLRLPSLAAGALYFFTVYKLSLLLFPETTSFLLSVLLLSLNPLVLDFLVAARGYGMALALALYGLYRLILFLTETAGRASHRNLYWASASLGLSIAANLTLLIPAAMLALLFLIALAALDRSTRSATPPAPTRKTKKKREPVQSKGARYLRTGYLHFLLPLAAMLYAFFLIVPIQMAQVGNFYAGLPSPIRSVENLVNLSFSHNIDPDHWNQIPALFNAWNRAIAFAVVPLAVLTGSWLWFGICRKWSGRGTGRKVETAEAALYLTNGTLLGSGAALIAAHYLADLPYPVDRTGLYFVPLMALAGLISTKLMSAAGGPAKAATFAVTALLAIFVLQFAAQFNTSRFTVWWYDADTRNIVAAIAAREKPAHQAVRVGATWQLEPSINFYRKTWALDWMAPVDRSGPQGDYDYYVLALGDTGLAKAQHLQKLYESHRSETILAVR